jgi:hypothetical protein
VCARSSKVRVAPGVLLGGAAIGTMPSTQKGLAVIYVLDAPSGARRPTPPVTASVSRAKANVTWLQSVPNPLGLHAPPNSDLPILGPARRIWSRWRAHIDGHSFVSLLSNSGMPIEDLARIGAPAAFRVVLSSVRDSFRCSHRRYRRGRARRHARSRRHRPNGGLPRRAGGQRSRPLSSGSAPDG